MEKPQLYQRVFNHFIILYGMFFLIVITWIPLAIFVSPKVASLTALGIIFFTIVGSIMKARQSE